MEKQYIKLTSRGVIQFLNTDDSSLATKVAKIKSDFDGSIALNTDGSVKLFSIDDVLHITGKSAETTNGMTAVNQLFGIPDKKVTETDNKTKNDTEPTK